MRHAIGVWALGWGGVERLPVIVCTELGVAIGGRNGCFGHGPRDVEWEDEQQLVNTAVTARPCGGLGAGTGSALGGGVRTLCRVVMWLTRLLNYRPLWTVALVLRLQIAACPTC